MAMEAIPAQDDVLPSSLLMEGDSLPHKLVEEQEESIGVTGGKKRARVEDGASGGFGASTGEASEEDSKRPKRTEGEVPSRGAMDDKEEGSDSQSKATRSNLPDIFDAGDEDDYEHSTDRARRLSYLTSTGAKPKKNDRYEEKSSFAESSRSSGTNKLNDRKSHISGTAFPFASPNRSSTQRNKMEQQEFVKDSVQSKLTREAGTTIKAKTSKPLDFNSFFQSVASRTEQIKLVTAEQVGLSTLMDTEEVDLNEEDGEVAASDDEDEISLDIDDEDEDGESRSEKIYSGSDVAAMPPPKTKAPVYASVRSKKMVVEEDDESQGNGSTRVSVSKLADPVTRPTLSLDDFGLDEDEADTSLKQIAKGIPAVPHPILTQSFGGTNHDLHLDESPENLDMPNSQTSVTEETTSSLKLELAPTLDIVDDSLFAFSSSAAADNGKESSKAPLAATGTSSSIQSMLITPGGIKLKGSEDSAATTKKSLMSSWLSGKSTGTSSKSSSTPSGAKKTSANATAKQTGNSASVGGFSGISSAKSSASTSKTSKAKSATSSKTTSAAEGFEFFDENAMTGDDSTTASALTRLRRTKQLFDDEAEIGFGSDVDEEDRAGETSADSTSNKALKYSKGGDASNGGSVQDTGDDEDEGGSSQDEYEVDEAAEAEAASRIPGGGDDIFETDDRAVIRSAIMAQELAREEEEARRATELNLRRDRNAMRMERALNAEANMLLEERRMEERLAARRENRSKKKNGNSKEDSYVDISEISTTSTSMPLPTTEKEWFMDDDEDEDNADGRGADDANDGFGLTSTSLKVSRRFEALEEQHSRRRLASSSQFLMQDENSQSILQLIERANTQHSQPSASSFHDSTSQLMMDGQGSGAGATIGVIISEESQDAFSLGGFFDRPSFSSSNAEHLTKLKATFKGNNTQLQSSALLFQRSQDGFGENSQDSHTAASSNAASKAKAKAAASKPSIPQRSTSTANSSAKAKK